MAPSNQYEYSAVDYSSDEKDVEIPFSKDSEVAFSDSASETGKYLRNIKTSWFSAFIMILPWMLTAFFGITTAILWMTRPSLGHTNQRGIDWDGGIIDPASIPLEEVRFSGTPQFGANRTRKSGDPSAPWPENVKYFGEPSPEIDANWERLIEWRYFSISEKDAKKVWPDTYQDYVDEFQGGYTAGLDVFHTLHCVNTIRQALRPDYYPPKPKSHMVHLDHCLDILRQHVQCAGGTTLIPTRFIPSIERNYIDSDQFHTCRSITYLRDWVTARKPGGPGYVERDITIIDPAKNALARAKMEMVASHLSGSTEER